MRAEITKYVVLKKKKPTVLRINNSKLKVSYAELNQEFILMKFFLIESIILDLFNQLKTLRS